MLFAVDSYFHIGQAHLNAGKPCQDYALADIHEDMAFALVSDGCSTGGQTDVGARILALSTAKAIREHWSVAHEVEGDAVPLHIAWRQKDRIAGLHSMLGLRKQDMLATCLYQYITPGGGFIHIQGDGVVAVKYQSGLISMCRYDWADNKPFYPAYTEDHFMGFIQDHGGDVRAERLTKECWQYYAEDGFIHLSTQKISLGEGMGRVTIRIYPGELEVTHPEYIAVFSDGITQIDGLDWKDAVVQALAFKTPEGEFAKRRMIRLIKDAQRNGKGPIDDIACAVVRIISSHEEGVV